MRYYYPKSKADDDDALVNQRPKRRQRSASYPVTEFDLIKLSKLFGCLEEALKEMIRNRGRQHPEHLSEMYFYEMTSRAPVETDDPQLTDSIGLAYEEEANR